MCYHQTSPRLNEATRHPVLHMHSPRGNNDRLQNQPLTHTRKKTETGDSVYFLALQIPIMLTPMRSGIALASPVVGSQTSPKPWRFQDALFLPTSHAHTPLQT